MRRVLVIGLGGAGKSALAARPAARTQLPLIHLDAHYWKPGWIESSKDDWTRKVDGRVRPDMTDGCVERIDWDFILWIWTYQPRKSPGFSNGSRCCAVTSTS